MLTRNWQHSRFSQFVATEITGLWNLFFPPACFLCGERLGTDEHNFCRTCQSAIPLLHQPYCACCALPFTTESGNNHLCGQCLLNPPPFNWVRAAGVFEGGLREAIHQLKFSGQFQLAAPLADLILDAAVQPIRAFAPDVLIAVPLHPNRLRERTFNQSLLLAKALGNKLKIDAPPQLLNRIRPTLPQQSLAAKVRNQNLAGAFSVNGNVSGRRVLLVDDVLTTGATARECARTLRWHGAEQIAVVAAARAPRKT